MSSTRATTTTTSRQRPTRGEPAGGGDVGGAACQRLRHDPLATAGTWTLLALTYDGATSAPLCQRVTGRDARPSRERSPISSNPLQIGGDSLLRPVLHRADRRGADLRRGADGRRRSRRTWARSVGGINARRLRRISPRRRPAPSRGRPQLEPVDRRRGHHRLPGRALPGRGLHELHADRDADGADVQRHGPDGEDVTTRYRVRAVDTAGTLGAYSNLVDRVHRDPADLPRQVRPHAGTDAAVQRHGRRAAARRRVTWSVDGVAGGSTASGRSRPRRPLHGAGRGRHAHDHGDDTDGADVERRPPTRPTYAGMFTYHDDNMRTGAEPERDGPHAGERQLLELRQALLASARRHSRTRRRCTSRTSRSRGRARTTSSTSRPSTTASMRSTPTDEPRRRSGRTASSTRPPASRPCRPATPASAATSRRRSASRARR